MAMAKKLLSRGQKYLGVVNSGVVVRAILLQFNLVSTWNLMTANADYRVSMVSSKQRLSAFSAVI
jgi:hypothetical protein